MTDLWTTRSNAVQNSLALAVELPSTTEKSLQLQYDAADETFWSSPIGSEAQEEAYDRLSVIAAIMYLGDASVDEVVGTLHRALWVVLNRA